MTMKSIYYNNNIIIIMQDEPFHDFKGILHDCRLSLIKQMFPEVSNSCHSDILSHDLCYGIHSKINIKLLSSNNKS